MEELQSTEVLEREILEDARKKALRILKTADETIAAKTAEWNTKTCGAIAEIEDQYNKQKEQSSEKTMSRLPIDKLRLKADRIETLLKEAVDDWYRNTGCGRIVDLLAAELSKRLDICKGIRCSAKIKSYFSGMERKDAETVLKKAELKSDLEEIKSADPYPAIIIETDNTRIIVSIQNIIDYYLDVKREELVGALL